MIYILSETLRSLWNNKMMTFVTIGIIFFSMLIFSAFLLITVNIFRGIAVLEDKVVMMAYLEDGLSKDFVKNLEKQIESIAGVESVEYVSKKKALEIFKKNMKGQDDLLKAVEVNPLPASFYVYIYTSYKTPELLDDIAKKISILPGVEEVDYGKQWVGKLDKIIKYVFFIDLVLGIILGLSSIFIVYNTIKLTVFARKVQIEIMRLVGATNTFIEMPFILEGVIQGLIGSFLAIWILNVTYRFIASLFPFNIIYLPDMFVWGVVLFGVFLGYIGSKMSVRRYLKTIKQ